MGKAFIFSTSVHLFIFLMYFAHYIFFHKPLVLEDKNNLIIDFVKIEKIAKAPILGPSVEDEKKTELKKPEIKTIDNKEIKKVNENIKETKEEKNAVPILKKKKDKKIKIKTPKKALKKQQRATTISDVITTSEILYIKEMVKKLWQIPSTVRDIDLDINVLLNIDCNGCIINAKIKPSNDIKEIEEDLFYLLEDSIKAVLEHTDFNFSQLTEETKKFLANGQPLDLIFNPSEV